jgi:hypothetical protein
MHPYCADEYLEWGYRSKLIKEELQQYDGDLVCLQVSGIKASKPKSKRPYSIAPTTCCRRWSILSSDQS